MVTQSLMSASVSWPPTRNSLPARIVSSLSRDAKTAWTARSYAACVPANPDLYTPSALSKKGVQSSGRAPGRRKSGRRKNDATVDGLVDPVVDGINLGGVSGRVEVHSGKF